MMAVGFDDYTPPESLSALVLELYKKGCLQVRIGCCENTDPHKIEIEGFDGTLRVRCLKCKKRSSLGESCPIDTNVPDEVPYRGICKCGNNDPMKMSAFTTQEKVPLSYSICNLCEQFVQLPEVLSSERESDEYDMSEYVSCERCHAENKIKIIRDAAGEVEMIACANCNSFYLPKDDDLKQKVDKRRQKRQRRQTRPLNEQVKSNSEITHLQPSHQAAKPKEEPLYREVRQLKDLHRGDHIMWNRSKGYKHHAIVEHVLLEPGRISVVHYNGPLPGTSGINGKIVAETLDPFAVGQGRLFVVEYVNPFPPEEALRRAYSRYGEVQYGLVFNNCEHFATWCKTGHHISSQVGAVKDCFVKYASACGKHMLSPSKLTKGYGGYITVALMAGQEVMSCYEDIDKANKDRREGRLSRDAYTEIVTQRVFRGLGGLGGMAAGLALDMFIPTKGIAGFIGGTLGGMIGEFAGKHLGTFVIKLFDECQSYVKATF